jgi:hypothetical protein
MTQFTKQRAYEAHREAWAGANGRPYSTIAR